MILGSLAVFGAGGESSNCSISVCMNSGAAGPSDTGGIGAGVIVRVDPNDSDDSFGEVSEVVSTTRGTRRLICGSSRSSRTGHVELDLINGIEYVHLCSTIFDCNYKSDLKITLHLRTNSDFTWTKDKCCGVYSTVILMLWLDFRFQTARNPISTYSLVHLTEPASLPGLHLVPSGQGVKTNPRGPQRVKPCPWQSARSTAGEALSVASEITEVGANVAFTDNSAFGGCRLI